MTDERIQEQQPHRPNISADDLITLNEEIAGMARAGLPLDQGLAVLAREMGGGRLKKLTAQLAADLQAGQPIEEAIRNQERSVPPFYAALVAAGVRSGRISDVLSTLTLYTRQMNDLRATIISAMIYPIMVIIIALGLMILFSYFVTPQFDKIFKDFKLRLPVITEAALFISRHVLYFTVVPTLAILFTWLSVRTLMLQTAAGKRTYTRWIYAIPIIGTLIHSARLASFIDLLGILVDYQIPLPEAFRMAGEASSDPILTSHTPMIEHELREGRTLAQALQKQAVMPEVVTWMAGVGEKRGTLGPTLHRLADMYRRQAEMRVGLTRTALPSVLVIVTASLVLGVMVICMFAPLLSLLDNLGGGGKLLGK